MSIPIRFKEEGESLELSIGNRNLSVFRGNVTSLKVDALVCPVDQNLDFRSGVARIISQSAGPNMKSQRPSFPEPYGKVVVLPGEDLKAKYVFLTVLLGEKGLEKMKISIRQAVERTIRYAEFLRLKSIAFPVLGCPKTNPPYHFVAREMMENVILYFQRRNTKLNAVFFSIYNADAFEAFRKEAKDISSL